MENPNHVNKYRKKEELVPESELVVEEEVVGKYTYNDLRQLDKSEQVIVLKDFGVGYNAIKRLKNEADRIELVLELQG